MYVIKSALSIFCAKRTALLIKTNCNPKKSTIKTNKSKYFNNVAVLSLKYVAKKEDKLLVTNNKKHKPAIEM